MANTMVVCGGTGAHGLLAFLRLHVLGHSLGFFDLVSASGRMSLSFPDLYLVDQDAGDGQDRKKTAWQEVKQLLGSHPAQHAPFLGFGRKDAPVAHHHISPFPLGVGGRWSDRTPLHRRFGNSPYRDLLLSQRQQQIDYSLGMMGSPAVGALLFQLKELDLDEEDNNRDALFQRLLEARGRAVVIGSGVGGTGAAVGPTLATTLARGRRERGDAETVMAVMIGQ